MIACLFGEAYSVKMSRDTSLLLWRYINRYMYIYVVSHGGDSIKNYASNNKYIIIILN